MSSTELKFGPKVPGGAVNLAWVSIPEVTADQNVFVADLAKTIPGNVKDYSNSMLGSGVSSYVVTLGNTGTTLTSTSTSIGVFSCPIQVLPPEEDTTGAWHLRIRDGVFRQLIRVSSLDKSWISKAFSPDTLVMAVYTIPEIRMSASQSSTRQLYSFTESNVQVLSSRMVGLSHRNVTAVSAISINGISVPTTADYVSTNKTEGTLTFLTRTVSPTDDIHVSYSYVSSDMVYYGFFDDDGVYRDLDLNPVAGHSYNAGGDSSMLINRVISLFLVPSAAYDYEAARRGSFHIHRAHDYGCTQFIRWSSDLLGGIPHIPLPTDDEEDYIFVPRGAYKSARYGIHHFTAMTPEEEVGGDNYSARTGSVGDIADYPSSVVLARVYVSPAGTVKDLSVVDTRTRGGGLTDDPERRQATLSGNQLLEAGYCWDIGGWDGIPAMLNGTTVVEIPEVLLTRRGGAYTEAMVNEIVQKRIPVGVLPVIRYTTLTATDEPADIVDASTARIGRASTISVSSVSLNGTLLTIDTDYTIGEDTVTITFTSDLNPESDTVLVTYTY